MKYTDAEREEVLNRARERVHQNGRERVRVPRKQYASEVTPEKIEWLWPGRLARGKITLLEGDPGLGKSTLTIDIAAKLSTGTRLPWGVELPPTGTLFMSAEDGVADTIVPRLIAAGADLRRIVIMDSIHTDEGEEGIQIPRDLDLIETVMHDDGCSLVVVDPLSVFLGDDINENKNQEVRKALAPAKAMFERARVSGLLLRHLTKSQSSNPVYRGAGSIGLGGAARFVMMVGEEPEIPDVKVLANVKENIRTRERVPSLTFQVVSAESDPDTAAIHWTGESAWKAKDLQMAVDEEEGDRLREAKEWLRDYLTGGVGATVKNIQKESRDAGHAWRTIERAKKALKVKSIKNPVDGVWVWRLDTMVDTDHVNTANENDEGRQEEPAKQNEDLARAIGNVGGLGTLPKNNNNNNDFIYSYDGGLLGGLPPDVGGLESERINPVKPVNSAKRVDKDPPPW